MLKTKILLAFSFSFLLLEDGFFINLTEYVERNTELINEL